MRIIIDNKIIDESIVNIKDVDGTSIVIHLNDGTVFTFREGKLDCSGEILNQEFSGHGIPFDVDLSKRQTRLLYNVMKRFYGDK